ncbi:MAG: glycosyltransferase family 4 protein [Gammaproteobacteria bacterium]
MKILLITQYFWPENFRINDLALDLQSKGYTVTVYTGFPNYPGGSVYSGYGIFGPYMEDYNGIKIKRIPLIPRGNSNRIQLVFNYLSFAMFSCIFILFRLRQNFDVIFVYEPSPITVCFPAILIKKIKKIPVILWVQDLWPESLSATGAVKSEFLLTIVNRLVNYIYHSCDLILVQSKAFIESIKSFGIDGDRIRYFPNSAEKMYKPIANSNVDINNNLPDGFRIVFAGNIGAAQSMRTIIDAADILKDQPLIQWVIIGQGRMKRWLEDEVKRRGLGKHIHLLGQKTLEEMPYYFSAADILVATLKRDPIFSLTVPSKIQSYLACAKPIVVAIDGEVTNVIEESGAGIAVPAENAEELASAVITMYKMTVKERKNMGASGRKYFEENFEGEKLVRQLEQWIHELA